ncbi:MAG: hypothetical protein MUF08_16985 [Burkholderiaceae bacterium]|nr:hypothetical protein [Burkholderiaceae bacterium]
MHLTTQQVQAAAAKQLAAVRRRAAQHLATARDRPGNPGNLTLGKLVDDLADEATAAAGFAADLCSEAGDQPGADAILADLDAILADLFGTHQHLTRQGIVCRSLAMQAWNHAPGTSLAAA